MVLKLVNFIVYLYVIVTGQIYWFNILQYFQYFSIYLVFIRSGPVHSLQVMMSTILIYYIILHFGDILVVKCLFAMSNVKGWERKYSLYRSKSPLLFPDWNCSQSLATNWNTFSFQFIIIFVGCNLVFKGANQLVSFTYLVASLPLGIYHLFGASILPGAPELINSIIHSTLVLECTETLYWLLSSHALAPLSSAARLWREKFYCWAPQLKSSLRDIL